MSTPTITTPDLEAVKTNRQLGKARADVRLATAVLADVAGQYPVNLIRLDLAIATVRDARDQLATALAAHEAAKAGCVL